MDIIGKIKLETLRDRAGHTAREYYSARLYLARPSNAPLHSWDEICKPDYETEKGLSFKLGTILNANDILSAEVRNYLLPDDREGYTGLLGKIRWQDDRVDMSMAEEAALTDFISFLKRDTDTCKWSVVKNALEVCWRAYRLPGNGEDELLRTVCFLLGTYTKSISEIRSSWLHWTALHEMEGWNMKLAEFDRRHPYEDEGVRFRDIFCSDITTGDTMIKVEKSGHANWWLLPKADITDDDRRIHRIDLESF